MSTDTIDLKNDCTTFVVERIYARPGQNVLCPNISCGKVYHNTFFVAYSLDRKEVYCKYCNPNPRLPKA